MVAHFGSKRFEELFLPGTQDIVNRVVGIHGHKGCAEFVRLKNIKQQAYGGIRYIGLVNTRFKHSWYTFLNAIKYLDRTEEIFSQNSGTLHGVSYNHRKATVTLLAALLHDIGQTSPGHFWEKVKTVSAQHRTHEEWSAVIIESPETEVHQALERLGTGIAQEVADMIRTEAPRDFWDMIVSSQFDADRVANVVADGLMMVEREKGQRRVHPHPFNLDAFLKHVEIRPIPTSQQSRPDDQKPTLGFVIRQEGIKHIESLLVGRKEIYWAVAYNDQKIGMQAKLLKLLEHIQDAFLKGNGQETNVPADHPAVAYLTKPEIDLRDYLGLTDKARELLIERASCAKDPQIRKLAAEIELEKGFQYIDVTKLEETERKELIVAINEHLTKSGMPVLNPADAVKGIYFSCYPGPEQDVPSLKRVWVLQPDGTLCDAAAVSTKVEDLAWGQNTNSIELPDEASCQIATAVYSTVRKASARFPAPR